MWHFDKCRLRRVCAVPFKGQKLQIMFGKELNTYRIFKRQAKALISQRVCPGWSEPLLVAHTTLLEISCRGSYCLALLIMSFTKLSLEATKSYIVLSMLKYVFYKMVSGSYQIIYCLVLTQVCLLQNGPWKLPSHYKCLILNHVCLLQNGL